MGSTQALTKSLYSLLTMDKTQKFRIPWKKKNGHLQDKS
jgi:hypothetical protein